MDINEIIAAVTEGLPADQAASVRAAIERDAVKTKVAGWKQQSDYEALQRQQVALQAELDGAPDKPGTRAYAKWYHENLPAIQALQESVKAYETKYGKLDGSTTPTTAPTAAGLTADEVQRLVDRGIQERYAPRWSELLEGTGNLVQKHMFAGRKTPIDFKTVSKLAQEKYQGNLEMAYDEWDKPEREKTEVAARESEIKRRVDEELQKRGASANFPAGADLTPGTLSSRTKAETEKFDKTALVRDLAQGWNTNVQ